MEKATPRPWLLNAHHERIIVDANHRTLADMTGLSNEIAERTANARLVIEAVNSFDQLKERIEILEEVLRGARKHLKTAWTYAALDSPVLEMYLRLIDEALGEKSKAA